MAEGTYVKLTKEQISSENITPGELHQPIDVIRVCIFTSHPPYISIFFH